MMMRIPTEFPVRLTLVCQACNTVHVDIWPAIQPCPQCQSAVQSILSGRVSDAMIFEQAAFVRRMESGAVPAQEAT
jgi:hypothetical protein